MDKATPNDFAQVDRLLAESRLPALPVSRTSLDLWVCRENDRVIGAIALEAADRCGLVRSAVVKQTYRGRGLGQKLVRGLIEAARGRSLDSLYLLTETAEPFFASLGFERVDRDTAPESIRSTEEFRSQCPDSAALMRLGLETDGPSTGGPW